MEPRSELLVFNKKEIGVIITLLVLVAMFSFTLGLKLGRTLGGAKPTVVETPPLSAAKPETGEHVATAAAQDDHGAPSVETHEAADENAAPVSSKKGGHSSKEVTPEEAAQDHADAELSTEASREKVGLKKPMPMTLPSEKKGDGASAHKFTLQVGSYRTVAEATEQVSNLKHRDLEAFYVEAKVPGKGTWYRVGIGVFPSKEEAERTAVKWKESRNLPSFIVQRL